MAAPNRLVSLDALRGFDMLLIAGGGSFLVRLHGVTGLNGIDELAEQMEHSAWNGFTFYDLIFPLFLFITGVSLSISMANATLKKIPGKVLLQKAFRRFLILWVLDILYKNAPIDLFHPGNIRYVGVLSRIGLAGLVTTWLLLRSATRSLLFWIGGILLCYFLAMKLIPVPGYGAGQLTLEGNLAGWIDRQLLPGRLIQKVFDENGLLTQLPALCLCIAGAIAGRLLCSPMAKSRQARYLLAGGTVSVLLGLAWHPFFPINKHLWSSSFILLTTGLSAWLLALFYWLIEVKQYQKWAFPFQIIGMNALLIYYAYHFIDFGYTSKMFFAGFYNYAAEAWQPSLNALGALVLVWLSLYFFYRKKVFIKI